MPSPDKVRFSVSISPARMDGRTASRVKISCRAASGLSVAGLPRRMLSTMVLVVLVSLSSLTSFPSVPMIFWGFLPFFPFFPAGRRLVRE